MEKKAVRCQTLERLHERRKQVARLNQKSIKIMQIVSLTGLSYPTVCFCAWIPYPVAEIMSWIAWQSISFQIASD